MCDNCKHPKPKFEGKDFVLKLLETMLACNESFKAKETVKVLVGESNSLIKQHLSIISDVFACGTEKSKEFWHAVIRQSYVKGLITKEIETYGILKVTQKGKTFLKQPFAFQLTEDHDYDQLNTESIGRQKGGAADIILFKILKDHRKKIAKAKGLPPPIIFLEPSLTDMANQYPTNMEEMSQIQGVGQGKAEKYGQSFIDIIKKYVEDNEIERPSDMMVRSLANKSANKIYIIQNIDKKLPFSDIASAKGKTVDAISENGSFLSIF
jgi:ATP-dependent DNA helicase RecQ